MELTKDKGLFAISKIALITWSKSDYGLMALNHAKKNGVKIDTVIALDYSKLELSRMFFKLFVRHLGIFESLFFGVHKFFDDRKHTIGPQWNNQPFIHDLDDLADHVIHASSLRDPTVEQALKEAAPDVVVLGQCGLVPRRLLDIPTTGTLNAHCGKLPEFRGNHVVFWTCYQSQFDKIGYTIHLVDQGTDTGPILQWKHVPPRIGDNVKSLERRIYEIQAAALIDMASDMLNSCPKAVPQNASDGFLYFAMPMRKRRKALRRLRDYLSRMA